MWNVIINRWKQGFRTLPYPKTAPLFPQRFRGRPVLGARPSDMPLCRDHDPLGAISAGEHPTVDMGKLTFQENLKTVFPEGVFTYSPEYRLAAAKREDLIVTDSAAREFSPDKKIKNIFGRSFKLRHVSAGGCGGCEAETNVIQIVVFDLYRFGISYVSSPRHADGLIVTGPVTKNMALALRETYDAMPAPKIVIAAGTCAISGGPFQGSAEVYNGVDALIPVDVYIPGCPPHPLTILDGLLCVMDRVKRRDAPK